MAERSAVSKLGSLTGIDPLFSRKMSGCENHWNKAIQMHGFKNEYAKLGASKGVSAGRRTSSLRRHVKTVGFVFLWMGFFLLFDEFMVSIFDSVNLRNVSRPAKSSRPKVQSGFSSCKLFHHTDLTLKPSYQNLDASNYERAR